MHVEVVFDETSLVWPGNLRAFAVQPGDAGGSLCYPSSPRDGGVRFKANRSDGWQVVAGKSGCAADLALVLQFCARRVGLCDDWLGILGFVLPFDEHDDNDRFCAEAAVELMQRSALANALPRRIVDAVGPLKAWRAPSSHSDDRCYRLYSGGGCAGAGGRSGSLEGGETATGGGRAAEKHAAELLQAHASAAERLDKIHALVNGSMTSAMATTTVGHQILDFCRRLIHVARRRRFRVECFPRAENLDP